MSKYLKKVVIGTMASAALLGAGTGLANVNVHHGKICMEAALAQANLDLAAFKVGYAESATPAYSNVSAHETKWDFTTARQVGMYYAKSGTTSDDKYYTRIYLGKGCGIATNASLACRLYLNESAVDTSESPSAHSPSDFNLFCKVCTNQTLSMDAVTSAITQNSSVASTRLQGSELKTDQALLEAMPGLANVTFAASAVTDGSGDCAVDPDDLS